jgi:hypothetical protein
MLLHDSILLMLLYNAEGMLDGQSTAQRELLRRSVLCLQSVKLPVCDGCHSLGIQAV